MLCRGQPSHAPTMGEAVVISVWSVICLTAMSFSRESARSYRAVGSVLYVLDQGAARVRYNIALWYA